MTITPEREEEYKTELRRSFALVKPISLEAAAIFYPTLWEINPSTKALFKNTDMVKQGQKLMKILGVAVTSLRNFEAIRPRMQTLGRMHISYGVTAEMYPCVIEALLITLEKGLGDECTAETKAAWHWVMTLISDVCIDAAIEIDPTYGDGRKKSGGYDASASTNGGKKGAAGKQSKNEGDIIKRLGRACSSTRTVKAALLGGAVALGAVAAAVRSAFLPAGVLAVISLALVVTQGGAIVDRN